jgi:hypothetical protein
VVCVCVVWRVVWCVVCGVTHSILHSILTSHVSRRMSYVVWLMSHVSCLTSHVSCLMFHVSCLMSHVSCLVSHVLFPMSCVPCLVSHFSCLISHVSYLMSHVSYPYILRVVSAHTRTYSESYPYIPVHTPSRIRTYPYILRVVSAHTRTYSESYPYIPVHTPSRIRTYPYILRVVSVHTRTYSESYPHFFAFCFLLSAFCFLKRTHTAHPSFSRHKKTYLMSRVSDFNTPRSIFSLHFFFFDYARAIRAYYIFVQNPILKRGHTPHSPKSAILFVFCVILHPPPLFSAFCFLSLSAFLVFFSTNHVFFSTKSYEGTCTYPYPYILRVVSAFLSCHESYVFCTYQ